MDKFLSEVYGTGELVKEAQEENQAVQELYAGFESTVEELCKTGQLDPNQLTDQDMAEMWEGFVEKVAEDAEGEEKYASLNKEAWEQADAMGRIAAHAYVDEMNKIAAPAMPKTPAKPGHEWVYASSKGGKDRWAQVPKEAKGFGAHAADIFKRWTKGGLKRGKPESQLRRLGRIGAVAAVPATVGAAAYGGYKGYQALKNKEKTSSLTEEDVLTRAYDFLKQAGWVYDTGEPIPPEHGMSLLKQAQEGAGQEDEAEKEAALNQAALEHLAASGYPILANQ